MYYNRIEKVIKEFQKDKSITLEELFLMYSINQDIYNEIVYGAVFLSKYNINFVRKINKDNRNRENKKFSYQLLTYFLENSDTIYDLANYYQRDAKYIEDCFKTVLNKNKISQNIININNERLKINPELKMYFEFIENEYTFSDLARLHELTEYDIVNYFDSTLSLYVFQSQIDEVFVTNKNRENKVNENIEQMNKIGNILTTFLVMNKDNYNEKIKQEYFETRNIYVNIFNEEILLEMDQFYSDFTCKHEIKGNNYSIIEKKIKILNTIILYFQHDEWFFDDILKHSHLTSKNTICKYFNDETLSFIDSSIIDRIKTKNNVNILIGSKKANKDKSSNDVGKYLCKTK